ncbi:protein of unknown function [Paraburkholderia kururiensis]
MGVVGRDYNECLREFAAGVERGKRVVEQIAAGHGTVLLRHGRAGTAAGAGARNEGKKA